MGLRQALGTHTAITVLAMTLLASCSKDLDRNDRARFARANGRAERIIAVEATQKGFIPSRIQVAQGERATLRITRTTEGTCAKEVVFPGFGVAMALPLNEPIEVEIPTTEAGELDFHCGVGMYRGAVVVN